MIINLGFVVQSDDFHAVMKRLKAGLHHQQSETIAWPQFLVLLRHLTHYQNKKKLEKEQAIIAELSLSKGASEQLRDVFNNYDTTGKGVVDKKIIAKLFSELGIAETQEQRKELRVALDGIHEKKMTFA